MASLLAAGGLVCHLPAGEVPSVTDADFAAALRSAHLLSGNTPPAIPRIGGQPPPPPFILPRNIADHLTGADPFTPQEEAAANFDGVDGIDIRDVVVRVNQLHPPKLPTP